MCGFLYFKIIIFILGIYFESLIFYNNCILKFSKEAYAYSVIVENKNNKHTDNKHTKCVGRRLCQRKQKNQRNLTKTADRR